MMVWLLVILSVIYLYNITSQMNAMIERDIVKNPDQYKKETSSKIFDSIIILVIFVGLVLTSVMLSELTIKLFGVVMKYWQYGLLIVAALVVSTGIVYLAIEKPHQKLWKSFKTKRAEKKERVRLEAMERPLENYELTKLLVNDPQYRQAIKHKS